MSFPQSPAAGCKESQLCELLFFNNAQFTQSAMLASWKSQRGLRTMRPDTTLNQSATGRQATPVHSIITGIKASKTRHVQAINPAFLQGHTISR